MFVTSDVLEPRGSIKYASAYATSFDWCRNLELRPSLVGIFCSPSHLGS